MRYDDGDEERGVLYPANPEWTIRLLGAGGQGGNSAGADGGSEGGSDGRAAAAKSSCSSSSGSGSYSRESVQWAVECLLLLRLDCDQ